MTLFARWGLVKDHEFNLRWLRAARRVLKPDGTLWVTGTHHVIFSLGFALRTLGFKVINNIAWFKPNATPNALHTAFTHAHETLFTIPHNLPFHSCQIEASLGAKMTVAWVPSVSKASLVGREGVAIEIYLLQEATAARGYARQRFFCHEHRNASLPTQPLV